MNSKGSTWYTQSCAGMFLDMSLLAVTWGVDYETAPLGHNSLHPYADLKQLTASNKLCADSYFFSQDDVSLCYAEKAGNATTACMRASAPAGCYSCFSFSRGNALSIQVSLHPALGTLSSLSSQLTTK